MSEMWGFLVLKHRWADAVVLRNRIYIVHNGSWSTPHKTPLQIFIVDKFTTSILYSLDRFQHVITYNYDNNFFTGVEFLELESLVKAKLRFYYVDSIKALRFY